MPKLKTEDLERIREAGRASVNLRHGSGRAKVTVHMDRCGIAAGAREVVKGLLREMEKRELADLIVAIAGCGGRCDKEPMATVELTGQEPVTYVELNPEKMGRVLEEHILGGEVVWEYTLSAAEEDSSQD